MPRTLLLSLLLVLATAGVVGLLAWFAWGADDKEREVNSSTPTATAIVAKSGDFDYQVISQLVAGLTIERFRELLGAPWFATVSPDGLFTEHLFRGHDYWVQAVVDSSGTVQLMAITSCDLDFRPEFGENAGSFIFGPFRWNESTFADVSPRPNRIRYFTSGATANSYYYDEYSFGNPGNYKTYFVGINDACGYPNPDAAYVDFLDLTRSNIPFDPEDQLVRSFRTEAIPNTYAETAVFYDERALQAFQIGGSRILTRTAPPLLP